MKYRAMAFGITRAMWCPARGPSAHCRMQFSGQLRYSGLAGKSVKPTCQPPEMTDHVCRRQDLARLSASPFRSSLGEAKLQKNNTMSEKRDRFNTAVAVNPGAYEDQTIAHFERHERHPFISSSCAVIFFRKT